MLRNRNYLSKLKHTKIWKPKYWNKSQRTKPRATNYKH